MPRQEHILIIDDDVHTADYIAELLQAQGYQTDWAFDGEEALSKLRDARTKAAGVERSVDLIILDVMMPGIDGYEVVRRLKSDAILRHTSVIMVTGLGSSGSKTKGLELGADDYVTKPFTPEELLARVKAMLRVRAIERDVVQRNRELEALNTISRLTSHSLDLNNVLSTTLNQTLKLMSGRAALVALVNPNKEDEIVLRMHRGFPSQVESKLAGATWRNTPSRRSVPAPGDLPAEGLQDGAFQGDESQEDLNPTGNAVVGGLIADVAGGAETKIVTDLSVDPHLEILTHYGLKAAACTPLTAQRGIVGVLAVFGEDGTLWGERSVHLLEAVGGQVGVTIENARLYTRVSNYAEELARSQAQLIQAEHCAFEST